MNSRQFILRNISHFKPFYRLVAIAVVVAVAVIVGSLVVGDSVRGTLLKRVAERLGNTETIIFANYSYLDESIIDHLLVDTMCTPYLLSNGFVSISGKLIPVIVWGSNNMGIKKGEAKINRALYNEIKVDEPKEIALRLSAAGMVPLGSMFVTDTYTASLRLELSEVISVEQGGNINLKNEQTFPLNIFVNLKELAEVLEIPEKINLILSNQIISKEDFASAWNYTHSGLHVKTENQISTISSDRIFFQDVVVETLCSTDELFANRNFSYLSNSLSNKENTIPYSFITAVDYYNNKLIQENEIILSDYAAKRLNVKLNDTVSIKYFVSKQFKTLQEDSFVLIVKKIVPIEEIQTDNALAAEFPGLSNVERCTDWDSDLPINMSLITDEDEAYWEQYRNTPKALVSYSTFASRWANDFGSATALQISNTNKLKDLTYEMFDIQLIYPREAGIKAAKSGVDFSSLFLSLGFFIIISATMLVITPLSEMLFRRRDEIRLLRALGFSSKRIAGLLRRESVPIVLLSSLIGILVGLLYTCLLLFLLGNVWKGATHTDSFSIYPHLLTLFVSLLCGIVFSFALLYLQIFVTIKNKTKKINNKQEDRKARRQEEKFFSSSKLIWSSIFYSRKQALLSFVTLALGVFILFLVGLNRQGFTDSSQLRTATGGYSLWCETTVPVYHNIETEEGRAKLGLKDLSLVDSDHARYVQLLKYNADDASCLNLNKVENPNVLGIDMEQLKDSDFKITKTIFEDSCRDTLLCIFKTCENNIYQALVDETVLQWSLGKKLGDTLVYQGEKGKEVKVVLAGTIQNSVFQGYILMDKSVFKEIWSEISGSEIMLLKVNDSDIVFTKAFIEKALTNYGVRVMTTAERMKMFYSVIDTYLTIFLTLGGLGLLLGIFSFIIVVRKNLVARVKDITLYRSLGFSENHIFNLLYKENILIPLCAIVTGTFGSFLAVGVGMGHVSAEVLGLAALFLFIFVGGVVVYVKQTVGKFVKNLP